MPVRFPYNQARVSRGGNLWDPVGSPGLTSVPKSPLITGQFAVGVPRPYGWMPLS